MARILITGVSSQTGQALYPLLASAGHTVSGTYVTRQLHHDSVQLDPNDKSGVSRVLAETRPDIIVHLSALNLVDYCEDHPDEAMQANTVFTKNLVTACPPETFFIYGSSEYIFDGVSGPYTEESKPNPISVYGRSKWEGEQAVRSLKPDTSLVFRTTVVYGEDQYRKNFVLRLVDNVRQGRSASIPDDQVSSPTYTGILARGIVELMDRRATGVYNVAGPEIMSRYEFSRQVAEVFSLPVDLLKPVSTESLRQKAPRPLKAGLMIDKLRSLVGFEFEPNRDSLWRMNQKKT